MIKGRVFTIDERLRKGEGLKLTKEEATEWLNQRIRNRAKSDLKYPGDKKLTVDSVTNSIYEGLVEDWAYNKTVLEACRAVKLSRAYVMGVIEYLFDEDGDPIKAPSQTEDTEKAPLQAGTSLTEDSSVRATPYYASLVAIDEEFEKARIKGAKDIKKRKSK